MKGLLKKLSLGTVNKITHVNQGFRLLGVVVFVFFATNTPKHGITRNPFQTQITRIFTDMSSVEFSVSVIPWR